MKTKNKYNFYNYLKYPLYGPEDQVLRQKKVNFFCGSAHQLLMMCNFSNKMNGNREYFSIISLKQKKRNRQILCFAEQKKNEFTKNVYAYGVKSILFDRYTWFVTIGRLYLIIRNLKYYIRELLETQKQDYLTLWLLLPLVINIWQMNKIQKTNSFHLFDQPLLFYFKLNFPGLTEGCFYSEAISKINKITKKNEFDIFSKKLTNLNIFTKYNKISWETFALTDYQYKFSNLNNYNHSNQQSWMDGHTPVRGATLFSDQQRTNKHIQNINFYNTKIILKTSNLWGSENFRLYSIMIPPREQNYIKSSGPFYCLPFHEIALCNTVPTYWQTVDHIPKKLEALYSDKIISLIHYKPFSFIKEPLYVEKLKDQKLSFSSFLDQTINNPKLNNRIESKNKLTAVTSDKDYRPVGLGQELDHKLDHKLTNDTKSKQTQVFCKKKNLSLLPQPKLEYKPFLTSYSSFLDGPKLMVPVGAQDQQKQTSLSFLEKTNKNTLIEKNTKKQCWSHGMVPFLPVGHEKEFFDKQELKKLSNQQKQIFLQNKLRIFLSKTTNLNGGLSSRKLDHMLDTLWLKLDSNVFDSTNKKTFDDFSNESQHWMDGHGMVPFLPVGHEKEFFDKKESKKFSDLEGSTKTENKNKENLKKIPKIIIYPRLMSGYFNPDKTFTIFNLEPQIFSIESPKVIPEGYNKKSTTEQKKNSFLIQKKDVALYSLAFLENQKKGLGPSLVRRTIQGSIVDPINQPTMDQDNSICDTNKSSDAGFKESPLFIFPGSMKQSLGPSGQGSIVGPLDQPTTDQNEPTKKIQIQETQIKKKLLYKQEKESKIEKNKKDHYNKLNILPKNNLKFTYINTNTNNVFEIYHKTLSDFCGSNKNVESDQETIKTMRKKRNISQFIRNFKTEDIYLKNQNQLENSFQLFFSYLNPFKDSMNEGLNRFGKTYSFATLGPSDPSDRTEKQNNSVKSTDVEKFIFLPQTNKAIPQLDLSLIDNEKTLRYTIPKNQLDSFFYSYQMPFRNKNEWNKHFENWKNRLSNWIIFYQGPGSNDSEEDSREFDQLITELIFTRINKNPELVRTINDCTILDEPQQNATIDPNFNLSSEKLNNLSLNKKSYSNEQTVSCYSRMAQRDNYGATGAYTEFIGPSNYEQLTLTKNIFAPFLSASINKNEINQSFSYFDNQDFLYSLNPLPFRAWQTGQMGYREHDLLSPGHEKPAAFQGPRPTKESIKDTFISNHNKGAITKSNEVTLTTQIYNYLPYVEGHMAEHYSTQNQGGVRFGSTPTVYGISQIDPTRTHKMVYTSEPLTLFSIGAIFQFSFLFSNIMFLKYFYKLYGKELIQFMLNSTGWLQEADENSQQEIGLNELEKALLIVKKPEKRLKNIAGIKSLLPEISLVIWYLRHAPKRVFWRINYRLKVNILKFSQNIQKANFFFEWDGPSFKTDQNEVDQGAKLILQSENSLPTLKSNKQILIDPYASGNNEKKSNENTLLYPKSRNKKNKNLLDIISLLKRNISNNVKKQYTWISALPFEEKEKLVMKLHKTTQTPLSLGDIIPKGILLIGPPGTGKTFLVQALAGESEVPALVQSAGFLVSDPQLGLTRLEYLLDQAQKLAPCIIFIDEIDTLGATRELVLKNPLSENTIMDLLYNQFHSKETRHVDSGFDFQQKEQQSLGSSGDEFSSNNSFDLNGQSEFSNRVSSAIANQSIAESEARKNQLSLLTQFLIEMDGLKAHKQILFIGATNRAAVLDPALTRPGRFDKILKIDLPGKQKRIEILKLYSRNLGTNFSEKKDWTYLANKTVGLSAADLSAIMNQSSIKAILNSFSWSRSFLNIQSPRLSPTENKRKVLGLTDHKKSSFFTKINPKFWSIGLDKLNKFSLPLKIGFGRSSTELVNPLDQPTKDQPSENQLPNSDFKDFDGKSLCAIEKDFVNTNKKIQHKNKLYQLAAWSKEPTTGQQEFPKMDYTILDKPIHTLQTIEHGFNTIVNANKRELIKFTKFRSKVNDVKTPDHRGFSEPTEDQGKDTPKASKNLLFNNKISSIYQTSQFVESSIMSPKSCSNISESNEQKYEINTTNYFDPTLINFSGKKITSFKQLTA